MHADETQHLNTSTGWTFFADTEPVPWRCKKIQRALKRGIDLILASLLLLLLWPLMLAIAVLVRLTSEGPALFVQTRVGLNGAPYRMMKFRTMATAMPDGSAGVRGEVTRADARLTLVGGWLRAWRLDELPQLFHVLRGDMSLVGPRPDIPQNLERYDTEQLLRFAMPPGCTAWTFTRGAFANDWSTRQHINVEYVRRWSLLLDIKVILGSLLVLLRQQNTSPETSAGPRASKPGASVDIRP